MMRWVTMLLLAVLLAFGAILLWGYARRHPEDLPWTRLDLTRPVGAATGRKLAALANEPALCRALLGRAGVAFSALPNRADGADCGYEGAVRLRTGQALAIGWRPSAPSLGCPVAAGLALWEWHVVQPAARRHFGTTVASIEHFGSYSCRRMNGGNARAWSEHARANAVDIAAFRFADGRRVTMKDDWRSAGPKGAFLRDVRDGSCRLFATVLSPDFNAAHHDHLHFDQAKRGPLGWRVCR